MPWMRKSFLISNWTKLPCFWHLFQSSRLLVSNENSSYVFLVFYSCANDRFVVCWQMQPISQVCVWGKHQAKTHHNISPSHECWSPAVQSSLFAPSNICKPVSAHLYFSCGLNGMGVMIFGLSPVHLAKHSCFCRQILLIGVFHWFRRSQQV